MHTMSGVSYRFQNETEWTADRHEQPYPDIRASYALLECKAYE